MTRLTFLRNSLALFLIVAALPLFGWELGDPKSAYNELLDVTSMRTVASKHGQLVLYKVNSATFAVRLDEHGRMIDSGARAIDIEIDSAASDGENYYLAGTYGLIRIARDGSVTRLQQWNVAVRGLTWSRGSLVLATAQFSDSVDLTTLDVDGRPISGVVHLAMSLSVSLAATDRRVLVASGGKVALLDPATFPPPGLVQKRATTTVLNGRYVHDMRVIAAAGGFVAFANGCAECRSLLWRRLDDDGQPISAQRSIENAGRLVDAVEDTDHSIVIATSESQRALRLSGDVVTGVAVMPQFRDLRFIRSAEGILTAFVEKERRFENGTTSTTQLMLDTLLPHERSREILSRRMPARRFAALARGVDTMLAVWIEDMGYNEGWLLCQPLSLDGRPLSDARPLFETRSAQPIVRFDGENFLVVSKSTRLLATRISPDGRNLGALAFDEPIEARDAGEMYSVPLSVVPAGDALLFGGKHPTLRGPDGHVEPYGEVECPFEFDDDEDYAVVMPSSGARPVVAKVFIPGCPLGAPCGFPAALELVSDVCNPWDAPRIPTAASLRVLSATNGSRTVFARIDARTTYEMDRAMIIVTDVDSLRTIFEIPIERFDETDPYQLIAAGDGFVLTNRSRVFWFGDDGLREQTTLTGSIKAIAASNGDDLIAIVTTDDQQLETITVRRAPRG